MPPKGTDYLKKKNSTEVDWYFKNAINNNSIINNNLLCNKIFKIFKFLKQLRIKLNKQIYPQAFFKAN